MSEKSVAARLQVKSDRTLAVIGATPALEIHIGAADQRADLADADVVLLFVRDHADLQDALRHVAPKRRAGSILWIAYPKLSSNLAGDLHRDRIRAIVPDYGLDTVSQIAIDDDWSALRLKQVG